MLNIFSSLRSYAGKWMVKSSRDFTAEEINCVSSAEVVDSQYGHSVCFHMVDGSIKFIPLSQNSALATGAPVDLSKAKLLTLGKEGEADILRVEC